MAPNAVFEYAGDREVLDEDNITDIKIQEEEFSKLVLYLHDIDSRPRTPCYF